VASRKTVGVPVVGALAVVLWVPVTGLTLGDPGVTVGVPVVGALAVVVGIPVDGDTEGRHRVASRKTACVPVLGALAVVVWVPVTDLTLGDPGVTVGVLRWEPWQWWWGFQWMETQRGFKESQWVFLWWKHWQWWWGF
jgi:hypothetical protein